MRNLTITEIRNTVEKYERNIDEVEKVVFSGELIEQDGSYDFDINFSIITENGKYEFDDYVLTDNRVTKKSAIQNINKHTKKLKEDVERFTALEVIAREYKTEEEKTKRNLTVDELLEVEKKIQEDIEFAIEFGLSYASLEKDMEKLGSEISIALDGLKEGSFV